MPRATHGLHHYHRQSKRSHGSSEHAFAPLVDKIMYVVGIFAPLMTVPQLYKIWSLRSAEGVSAFSWFAYALGSFAWFIYGVLHKEKPIIFCNGAAAVLQLCVAIGAIIFGSR